MKKLLISACLTGVNCKYSGGSNRLEAQTLKRLEEKFILVPICPERDGGLPTPRTPNERVGNRVINALGEDFTAEYLRGAELACAAAAEQGISLALLKEKSPSCGCGEIYDGSFSHTVIEGDGVTAERLKALGLHIYGETKIRLLMEDE